MPDDDDNFWGEYLVDRHQLSSQLSAAAQRPTNPCPAADCKGRCDCSERIHAR